VVGLCLRKHLQIKATSSQMTIVTNLPSPRYLDCCVVQDLNLENEQT